MSLRNIMRIALRSLGRNKMRSFLTMLGLIIGVATVIAMLAVGQGARDSVNRQIASLGTNVIIIFPGASSQGGVRMEAGTSSRMTEDDAQAIRALCPSVMYVSPQVRSGAQIKAGNQNWRTSVYGVYAEYLDIRDMALQSGVRFSETDERSATKVCIIGTTVANNLFGEGADPTGQ